MPKVDEGFINEKAKWIYENSICLDPAIHKIRHPITVEASINFVKQILQEAKPEITEKDLQAWADEAESRVEDEKRWGPLFDAMKEMLEELGIKVRK